MGARACLAPTLAPTLPALLCLPPQALRALRQALATLEGLPAELVGRVNASGKWSFKALYSPDKALGPAGAGAFGDGSPTKAPLGYANGTTSGSLMAAAQAAAAVGRRPGTAGARPGNIAAGYAGSPQR